WQFVCRTAGRRHSDRRRSHVLSGARTWSDCRASRDAGRKFVLSRNLPWSQAMETSKVRKRMPTTTLLDPQIVVPAIGEAFLKLDPRTLAKNPVMFVLEMVTLLTTILLVRDGIVGGRSIGFELQIVIWLWFTVLFANFAEAVA